MGLWRGVEVRFLRISVRYVFCVMIVGCLWVYGHSLQNPLKLSIQSIDKQAKLVQLPAMDLKVGESGLVWHRFDSNYASVIAEVVVVKVDSGVAFAALQEDGCWSKGISHLLQMPQMLAMKFISAR